LGSRLGPLSAIMARAFAVQGLYRLGYPLRPEPTAVKRFIGRAAKLVG